LRRNSTSPGRGRGRCQEAAGGEEGRQRTMANLALAPRASRSRTSESKSASRCQAHDGAHRSRPSAGREQQRRRSRRAGSKEGISLGKMAEAGATDRLPSWRRQPTPRFAGSVRRRRRRLAVARARGTIRVRVHRVRKLGEGRAGGG
jgi:hypothetical protein